jgi:hypothetical protein
MVWIDTPQNKINQTTIPTEVFKIKDDIQIQDNTPETVNLKNLEHIIGKVSINDFHKDGPGENPHYKSEDHRKV